MKTYLIITIFDDGSSTSIRIKADGIEVMNGVIVFRTKDGVIQGMVNNDAYSQILEESAIDKDVAS